MNESISSEESETTWDLRVVYVEWIKNYMVEYTIYERYRTYPKMLEKIQDWHSSVWGRVIKDFEKEKEDRAFKKIINNIITIANENHATYFGKDKVSNAISQLDSNFREAKTYIIWLMKKHALFGKESYNRGLT